MTSLSNFLKISFKKFKNSILTYLSQVKGDKRKY